MHEVKGENIEEFRRSWSKSYFKCSEWIRLYIKNLVIFTCLHCLMWWLN